MQEEIKAILIQDGEPTPNNPVKIKRLLVNKEAEDYITNLQEENERLNNIIDETTKYVESLSSSGRGCDIYEDIKKEILNELKGDNK